MIFFRIHSTYICHKFFFINLHNWFIGNDSILFRKRVSRNEIEVVKNIWTIHSGKENSRWIWIKLHLNCFKTYLMHHIFKKWNIEENLFILSISYANLRICTKILNQKHLSKHYLSQPYNKFSIWIWKILWKDVAIISMELGPVKNKLSLITLRIFS